MFRKDPVGSCFVATKNFTNIQQYRPCVETGSLSFHSPITVSCYPLMFFCILLRLVPPDTSGIHVTENDESRSVHVSPRKIIWKNFLSMRPVRQVSSAPPKVRRRGGGGPCPPTHTDCDPLHRGLLLCLHSQLHSHIHLLLILIIDKFQV